MPITLSAAPATANRKTSETTWSTGIPAAINVQPNDVAVYIVAIDNSAALGAAPTMTPTSGGTATVGAWTATSTGVNNGGLSPNAGVAISMWWARVSAAGTLTVTLGISPATTAKVAAIFAVNGVGTTTPVAPTATTGTSTGPSVTTASVPIGALVIGAIGIEGPVADSVTADSDTTRGTWNFITNVNDGTTSGTDTNIKLLVQAKIVTAVGTQTFNSTITSRDWVATALTLFGIPSSPPVPPARSTLHIIGR